MDILGIQRVGEVLLRPNNLPNWIVGVRGVARELCTFGGMMGEGAGFFHREEIAAQAWWMENVCRNSTACPLCRTMDDFEEVGGSLECQRCKCIFDPKKLLPEIDRRKEFTWADALKCTAWMKGVFSLSDLREILAS